MSSKQSLANNALAIIAITKAHQIVITNQQNACNGGNTSKPHPKGQKLQSHVIKQESTKELNPKNILYKKRIYSKQESLCSKV